MYFSQEHNLIKLKNIIKTHLSTLLKNKKHYNEYMSYKVAYKQKIDTYNKHIQNEIENLNMVGLLAVQKSSDLESKNDKMSLELYECEKQKDCMKNDQYFINIHYFKYVYKSNSDDVCGICYNDLINTTTLSCPKCNKQIHKGCVEQWLSLNDNKKCIYCVDNCWDKYGINHQYYYEDSEIILLDEENILLSEEYISKKTQGIKDIINKRHEINTILSMIIENNSLIMHNNDTLFAINMAKDKYKMMQQSYNMFLDILDNEIDNVFNSVDIVPKIKKLLKIIRILLFNIRDTFFLNKFIQTKILEKECEDFCDVLKIENELVVFIKKYKNGFKKDNSEKNKNIHKKVDFAGELSFAFDGRENIHADNYALRWSANYGHIEIVKVLLKNGTNIYA